MSRRAERRRAEREARRSARPSSLANLMDRPTPDEWVVCTDPGCDDRRHRDEIMAATLALNINGPWLDVTQMACGCELTLRRWHEVEAEMSRDEAGEPGASPVPD